MKSVQLNVTVLCINVECTQCTLVKYLCTGIREECTASIREKGNMLSKYKKYKLYSISYNVRRVDTTRILESWHLIIRSFNFSFFYRFHFSWLKKIYSIFFLRFKKRMMKSSLKVWTWTIVKIKAIATIQVIS